MVHIRLLSLGVPESAWPQLLEECLRVLSPGGYIEIVEMSLSAPGTAPANVQRSFASCLLAEMINPDPSLPIQFAIPTLSGLQPGMGKPVFSGTLPPGAGEEAVWAWMKSSLEYKGTSMGFGPGVALNRSTGSRSSKGPEEDSIERIKRDLRGVGRNGRSWDWDDEDGRSLELGDCQNAASRSGEGGERSEGPEGTLKLKGSLSEGRARVWVWIGTKKA